jgi:hypothetical protein
METEVGAWNQKSIIFQINIIMGIVEVKVKYKNPNTNKYMLEKLLCKVINAQFHLVKSCYAEVKMKGLFL